MPSWNYPPRAFAAPGSGGGSVTFSNTAEPAAPGSTLILSVGVRPSSAAASAGIVPDVTVTDNLGGVWERLVQGPTGASTFPETWMRRDAGGVTSITLTSAAGGSDVANIQGHPLEWTGATPGAIAVKPQPNASATSWPAAEVDAPAGSFVVGNMTLGVTNRALQLTAPAYVAGGEFKASSLTSLSAHRVVMAAETTGPTWGIVAGGTSTGASSSVASTVAVAPAGGPDPDPDPPPARVRQLLGADGTWRPATTTLL